MTEQSSSLYNLRLPVETKPMDISNAAGFQIPDFGDPKKINYFTVVFYLLLSSMQVRQGTVMTESKEIDLNAGLQNWLNDQNANIKFSILPSGAGNPTINRVQDENQQYAAEREDIQNALITTRQVAQVKMTQTSTNVNLLQQDASENSGILQTLNTVFQVIDEMTGK